MTEKLIYPRDPRYGKLNRKGLYRVVDAGGIVAHDLGPEEAFNSVHTLREVEGTPAWWVKQRGGKHGTSPAKTCPKCLAEEKEHVRKAAGRHNGRP